MTTTLHNHHAFWKSQNYIAFFCKALCNVAWPGYVRGRNKFARVKIYYEVYYISFSYLKTLLKPFNELTNDFLSELKQLANGKSKVPMKVRLGEFSLDVISKVGVINYNNIITVCYRSVPGKRLYGLLTITPRFC